MCEYQSSGPSHILVLSKGDFGETIIEEWLEVLGPPNVAEAQESAATRYLRLCLSVCLSHIVSVCVHVCMCVWGDYLKVLIRQCSLFSVFCFLLLYRSKSALNK